MRLLFPVFIVIALALSSCSEDTASQSHHEHGDESGTPFGKTDGVTVHWYGHGFIYLISSVGVRAAFDPFGPQTVHYAFPQHLSADFVLISHESEDHGASDLLFGNILNYRSITGVGLNRANGVPFHGVALQVPRGQVGANTAFTLKFDGVTFCYLGRMYGPLSIDEVNGLGKVDVLFLPVGLPDVTVHDLNDAADKLHARIIIPIEYKTDYSGDLNLRTLSDYLADSPYPIVHIPTEETVLTVATLPAKPTIYELALPKQP